MSFTVQDPNQLIGADVYGPDNDKLGKVDTVFLDNETSQVAWVAVTTGFFGTNVSLVPVDDANFDGTDVHVPYSKAQVKDAPNHDTDQALSESDEDELYRYYQVGAGTQQATATDRTVGTEQAVGTDQTVGTEQAAGVGHDETWRQEGYDTSGPSTDEAMTRSEEHLSVGTEQVEAGRARLRKYVVTEQQTVTVPVSHEEVRVEREAITDANRGDAVDGPTISEEEHEVVLHAERPVVTTEAVPVERVRLGTETVTEQEQVSGEVRKEQIEIDDPTTAAADERGQQQ